MSVFNFDFNFYPEQHLDELDGLLDVEVPSGWDIARMIRELHDARCLLGNLLLHVDDDGKVKWW